MEAEQETRLRQRDAVASGTDDETGKEFSHRQDEFRIGYSINISLPAILSPAREDSDATAPQEPIRRRKSLSNRVKSDWDSLLWVFAAFAVFYFTNFASTLVFNESVNG